jgi:hypothetical protein
MLTLALFRCANPGVAGVRFESHAVDQLWNSFESPGHALRTGSIPNLSDGMLKLLEPLDTSPQSQPRY